MNEYDSDHLARSLIHDGYIPVEDPNMADVILINTCAVRAKPEQKAASFLGRMIAVKEKRPDTILCIAGCMAQLEGINFFKRFPQINLVLGPRELDRFPEYLGRLSSGHKKIIATDLNIGPPSPKPIQGFFRGRVTGFVSIMEGCNNFCSYCIVPFVRGREVSRPVEDIISEVDNLISDGVKDITLLGQNVISYAHKYCDFVSLLHEISRKEGLLRLRFTTSHPKDLSDDIINCFRHIDKLCHHIHLPFQAGSNHILKKMKRGYTREQYFLLIEKLRAIAPDIAITSDVMVGFPGESDEDFELTLDLIRTVRFDNLFSFIYSDRKGTLADKMPDKVKDGVKSHRLQILQDIQREITLFNNLKFKNKAVDVLVEGKSKKGTQMTGRTATNKIVNFTDIDCKTGDIVQVIVKECFFNSLSS